MNKLVTHLGIGSQILNVCACVCINNNQSNKLQTIHRHVGRKCEYVDRRPLMYIPFGYKAIFRAV